MANNVHASAEDLTSLDLRARELLTAVVAGHGEGAPSNGGGGTLAGFAATGSLYVDETNGYTYRNVGTLSTPTWAAAGPAGGAAGDTSPAVLVAYRVLVTTNADGDDTLVVDQKTRVLDVYCINYATGTTGSIITVKNVSTAITDAIDVSGADKTVARAATIDDAQQDVAAATAITISRASTGADFGSTEVVIIGVLVA